MAERLIIGGDAAKHVQAYIDYQNIVGNDDGGKLLSDKQFEEYKQSVRQARKNRLYVSWRNVNGQDCRMMGPASKCFCGHRYKDHNFDNVQSRKVNCKTSKCKCKSFSYIPIFGSQDFKCLCKHSHSEHDPNSRKCFRAKCQCSQFISKHSCNCGLQYPEHLTIFQSRQQREAEGRPVDPKWMQDGSMIGGMGGVGSYLSLADDTSKQDMIAGTKQGAIEAGAKFLAIQGSKTHIAHSKIQSYEEHKSPLDLFNTPHKYGSGQSQPLTHMMKQLKIK